MPSSVTEIREVKLDGHVGFDSLPDQLVNRTVAQGCSFNVLCVGETGLGKSTLIDTLFNTKFDSEPCEHTTPKVGVKASTYDLVESNVQLKLTIVDTVGFGDQINKDDSFKPIISYIDEQFENYLQEELKIQRNLATYHDTRIHCCLYFLSPTGHGLKALDLVTMQKLDSKVNIVPIVAKSDTISQKELQKFKLKITSELVSGGIQIYQFPTDDDTVAEVNAQMNGLQPFAIVGSNEEMKVGNKSVRARQYPWGVVQVENEDHCEFVKLREMVLRINMDDLRETTHTRHYELFRRCRLQEMGFIDSTGDKMFSLQETFETKRAQHLKELQHKEDEMRQKFVLRVKEKEADLKQSEKEMQSKFESLKKEHVEERKRFEEKKRLLDEEMLAFTKKKELAKHLMESSTMKDKRKK